MGKRGARHRHPLLDIVDAEALRPGPHEQAENLQPTRLPECAELTNKSARHDISSIIEVLNAQVQGWQKDSPRLPCAREPFPSNPTPIACAAKIVFEEPHSAENAPCTVKGGSIAKCPADASIRR
jgi:hypothetical protein